MKILVIIPAFNEEKSIKKVIENIKKVKKNIKQTIDYIVINDASTDNTRDVCEQNKIPVINLIKNLGIGGAVQTGYKYALKHNYDIAIQMDGDNQHDANYLYDLIKPILLKKVNMTIGSRYVSDLSKFKSTKLRQLGIKILSGVLKLTTRVKIHDVTSGYRAVDKNIIKMFADNYPHDYPEPETLVSVLKKGYSIKEIPVEMKEREYGKSSITPLKSIFYMLKVTYAMLIRSIIERKDR